MSELLHPAPGSAPPTFPLRVGAVDIGSNAIRFLAAEFGDREAFRELEYMREPVRLGRETFRSGMLPADAMDAGAKAIARFRERMDQLELVGYRAVATSAVRDARNGEEFVERVWEECGVRIETITGTEEAHLVWLAVRARVPLGSRGWVLVDLGGGSVEVSLVDSERIRWSESHPLGTVRLLEELGDVSGDSPESVRRMIEDHAGMLRDTLVARKPDVEGMIATGGNMEALAGLAGALPDERGVSRVTLRKLRAVIARLAAMAPRERVRELGLREDRADVILPAAVVYERVAALVGAKEIVVPSIGLKDGLLVDVMEDIVEHGGHEARLEREAMEGARVVGERYQHDAAHAEHVTRLALDLFDQLADLHGLEGTERRMLAVAALLHDVGQFVSYRRHHKHSYYLISHAELPGFTPAQIGLVALVARYHRRAEPKDEHEGYAELSKSGREVVDRLAAILRVADALDREHEQQVTGVRAELDGKKLDLHVAGSGDLLPERWAVKRKAEMMEKVFDLTVRLRVPEEESVEGPR